jgi:hypothetical protein
MNIKNIINEDKLIKNPYVFFIDFIENNNIILNNDFENLNNWYNNYIDNNIIDYNIEDKYLQYIEIFKNYMNQSTKKYFNYIYYILILYYISNNKLNNFMRYFISNINFLINLNTIKTDKYINKTKNIINLWIDNINKTKDFNLSIIQKLINVDETFFFIFIISLQNYLI